MITSGNQGQLVNFFDPDALAQQVIICCKTKNSAKSWVKNAHSTFWRVVMTSKKRLEKTNATAQSSVRG